MKLRTFAMTYRSMGRMREVLGVLSRHGFHQVLLGSGLWRFVPLSERFYRGSLGGPITTAERLRMALEELGPTFVKLGQMLASRPDLVPPAFIDEFRKLQDRVKPIPFAEVKKVVEREAGAPLDVTFAEVGQTALASASMAQVHHARLADGTPVVLKVRRPDIARVILQDLAVMEIVIAALEHYLPESRRLGLPVIHAEFSRTILAELDFHREAAQTERFRRNFEGSDEIFVPRVFWDYCTRRLLVLERVEGASPADVPGMEAMGVDRTRVARILSRAFMKQVLEDGVFHADLHPGNLLVLKDGRVALLDFGAVGYLSEEAQETLGSVFFALLTRDYPGLAAEYLKIGNLDHDVDERRFERDLRELIEPYHGRPTGELRIGEILRESVGIAVRHKIQVPGEFVLLGRTALSVDGLVRSLDPNLVLLDEAIPFSRKLLLRKLDPRRHAKMLANAAADFRDFGVKLPSQLSRLMQRLIESRLSIEFVHKGYDKALDEIDRSSNRIAMSLVISAIIVGSALIVQSGKGPQLWDFPVFGLVGFVLAGVLGFGLAFQILRSGKF